MGVWPKDTGGVVGMRASGVARLERIVWACRRFGVSACGDAGLGPNPVTARRENELAFPLRKPVTDDNRGQHVELALEQLGQGTDVRLLISPISVANDATPGRCAFDLQK